jgi:hypothetical protein
MDRCRADLNPRVIVGYRPSQADEAQMSSNRKGLSSQVPGPVRGSPDRGPPPTGERVIVLKENVIGDGVSVLSHAVSDCTWVIVCSGWPQSAEVMTRLRIVVPEDRFAGLLASTASTQSGLAILATCRAPGTPTSSEERELQILAALTQELVRGVHDQLTELQIGRLDEPRSGSLESAHVQDSPLRPWPVPAVATGALIGLFIATVVVLELFWPDFAADRGLGG